MVRNHKKTKLMVFNYTDNYQFSTRLQLNNENLEIVKYARLLGVIISDNLSWDNNTSDLVKRSNARMELLRKVAGFSTSIEEKKNIYILYIRSILEQSSVVWHSSLTREKAEDLERVKKNAVRIILGKPFNDYNEALEKIGLQTLNERRNKLSLKFAKKYLKNDKTKGMFPLRSKIHTMENRNEEKYVVKYANTDRLKNSAIPYMQRMLNDDIRRNVIK